MVSDSDSGMEEERPSMVEDVSMSGGMGGETKAPEETTETASVEKIAKKRSGGRRAALRIVRENVERVSKELGNFRKAHEATSKRTEKQIAALRSDISALKSYIAKESTRMREKQDAALSRLFTKVNAPKSRPKGAQKKRTKTKKSKGKK